MQNKKYFWGGKCTHPQAIQDVDDVVFSSEHILRTYISCSPMDPLQWMGAVRTRVQAVDKNITSNPHHSSPSINVLWSEKLHVYKKQVPSLRYFKLKSIIHKNTSSQ